MHQPEILTKYGPKFYIGDVVEEGGGASGTSTPTTAPATPSGTTSRVLSRRSYLAHSSALCGAVVRWILTRQQESHTVFDAVVEQRWHGARADGRACQGDVRGEASALLSPSRCRRRCCFSSFVFSFRQSASFQTRRVVLSCELTQALSMVFTGRCRGQVVKLTNLLDGGPDRTERRKFILAPVLRMPPLDKHNMTR